jgi:hypothetical protein
VSLDLQGLALGLELLQLHLTIGENLGALAAHQQAALASEGVKAEKEHQKGQGGGWKIGAKAEEHRQWPQNAREEIHSLIPDP